VPAVIEFRDVVKRYGEVLAVAGIDLAINEGEFLSLLGPSGCGKTTSLRMIAGFEQPSEGEVLVDGEGMNGVPAYRRPVNMVFQHYALFPHLNVFDNVAYGLRQQRPRIDPGQIASRVGEALGLVRLEGYDRRRSHELSGGQQQRVALARALVNRPKVLLLDEPLAALDRKLRRDMQIELQNLQRTLGITFVLVTHDQEEALSMSDRVCIMRDGRIVQAGPPRALYDEPVNRYVADFVGKSNFLGGLIEEIEGSEGAVRIADGSVLRGRLPKGASEPARGSRAVIAVRPELVSLAADAQMLAGTCERTASATIRNRIFLGEHTEYLVEAAGLGPLLVLTPKRLEAETGGYGPGDAIAIGWPRHAALILTDDKEEAT
jgi:spermidine/putrescine transport system ATP-binding protein